MLRRLGLLLGALFALGVLFAAPALAHAELIGSRPADGARLASPPHRVTLHFDEAVVIDQLAAVRVTDRDGRRVDTGDLYNPHGDEALVAVRLERGVGRGTFTVRYRLLSDDGHPVTGSLRFVVGAGPLGPATGAAQGTDPVVKDPLVISRWISYAGVALLTGAWLLLTIWPEGRGDRRARRLVITGWAGAVAGALLELALEGPYATGGGLEDVGSGAVLRGTLGTRYGHLHVARLALLAALAVALVLALRSTAVRWLAALSAGLLAAIAWTFAAVGHPATTSPVWLSECVDALHLLSVVVWLGGLAMLVGAVLPRRDLAELRHVLPRFSTVAMTAVAVLVAAGSYNAWRGIGSWSAVFTTTYGLIVVAKVVLLAGILTVANLSRRLVRRPAHSTGDAADDEERQPFLRLGVELLRRAVWVEAVVAFVVLIFSAVLVGEPRGRDAQATSVPPPAIAAQVHVQESRA